MATQFGAQGRVPMQTGRFTCVRPVPCLACTNKAGTQHQLARSVRHVHSADGPAINRPDLNHHVPKPTPTETVLTPDICAVAIGYDGMCSQPIPNYRPAAQTTLPITLIQQSWLAPTPLPLHAVSLMQGPHPISSIQRPQHATSSTRPTRIRRVKAPLSPVSNGMDCTCCAPGLGPLLALPDKKTSSSPSPEWPMDKVNGTSQEGQGQGQGQGLGQGQGQGQQGSQVRNKDDVDGRAKDEDSEDTSLPVRAALGMLSFYRNVMSPLMPSSCRYQPTCSNYSIQSYKKYGVWKGSVLTAWRLLRCSPLGSSGYDPPMWPPPGLGLLYGDGTWDYGPHVTVVVGAAFLAWLANALWTEISYII